jgi:hypothetical protein
MKNVDLYLKVRHAVRIEGLSERATARRFGIDPRTVNKMMKFSVPPGYVRKKPPTKPKLDPFISVIDGILGDDKSRPKPQQHTAKRIFERLRDEHGFTGGITIVNAKAGAGFKSLADTWADTTTPHGRLMLTVLGGLAEFERELIKARTGEGRKRAMANGIKFGRPFTLTRHQREEAIKRRDAGETLVSIARSYNVSHPTIMRLLER